MLPRTSPDRNRILSLRTPPSQTVVYGEVSIFVTLLIGSIW